MKSLMSQLGVSKSTLIVVAGGGAILGIATAVYLFNALVAATHKRDCGNNLKQIVLALHAYSEKYGCLPPAYVTDDDGRPMHSWRVLILPFMDHQEIYDAYHFDEPWDGPRNKLLLKTAVQSNYQWPYKCWFDKDGHPETTSYVVVTGSGTAYPDDRRVTFRDFPEAAKFPLVIEMAHSSIPWLAPIDLAIDKMSFQLNDPRGNSPGSRHHGYVNMAFADGAVHTVYFPSGPDAFIQTDEESLKTLLRSVRTQEEERE